MLSSTCRLRKTVAVNVELYNIYLRMEQCEVRYQAATVLGIITVVRLFIVNNVCGVSSSSRRLYVLILLHNYTDLADI